MEQPNKVCASQTGFGALIPKNWGQAPNVWARLLNKTSYSSEIKISAFRSLESYRKEARFPVFCAVRFSALESL